MPLLPHLDLHFSIRVSGPVPDLPFLGPTVRGLLGYGLRQTCCGHDADESGRCRLGEACSYSYLFEGPPQHRLLARRLELTALPQPFMPLLEPTDGANRTGQHLGFGIRLFGAAMQLAPQVGRAVIAREPFGFGARSRGYRTEEIAIDGATAWSRFRDPACDELHGAIASRIARAVAVDEALHHRSLVCRDSIARWRFVTPVALRDGPVRYGDWGRLLLDGVQRRAWLLEHAYPMSDVRVRATPRPIRTDGFETTSVEVQPVEFTRRSTRHGRVVRLSGAIGSVAIRGPWAQHAELIARAMRYGVGRWNSFGFGRVEVALEDLPPQTMPCAPADTQAARERRARVSIPRWLRLRGQPPEKSSRSVASD